MNELTSFVQITEKAEVSIFILESMTTSDGNKSADTAFGVNQNGSTATTATNPQKKQTTRKVFSHAAQLELENAFRMSPYLTAWKRQCLSQKLSLTERQVRVWFQNRRMRIKSERGRCGKPSPTKKHVETSSTKASPPPDYSTATTTTGFPNSLMPYTSFQPSFQSPFNQAPIYTATYQNGAFSEGLSLPFNVLSSKINQISNNDSTVSTTNFPITTNSYPITTSNTFYDTKNTDCLRLPCYATSSESYEQQQNQFLEQQKGQQIQQNTQQFFQQDNETAQFINNFDITELRALTTCSYESSLADVMTYGNVI
ncbi:homeobox protein Nkx-2.2a-like [Clytia hemisphaerica]